MSGVYETSRRRISDALNNNVGQRMTTELAVGIFMLVDGCLRDLVAAMTPGNDEAAQASPGLTEPED